MDTGVIDCTRRHRSEQSLHSTRSKSAIVKRGAVGVGSACEGPVERIEGQIGWSARAVNLLENLRGIHAYGGRKVVKSVAVWTDDCRSVIVGWWSSERVLRAAVQLGYIIVAKIARFWQVLRSVDAICRIEDMVLDVGDRLVHAIGSVP